MTARNKLIIAACAVVAFLAAGSAAYYFKHGDAGPNPAKMSAAQIQTYMQSPDFNSMPRPQRRAFFEQVADARAQGYFATPVQDRDQYLDKIIDDMQKFRTADFNSQRPRDPNRMRQAQQRNNRTPEQNRFRRETRDPVKEAMRREFGDALRARAQSRGIQMGGGAGRRPL